MLFAAMMAAVIHQTFVYRTVAVDTSTSAHRRRHMQAGDMDQEISRDRIVYRQGERFLFILVFKLVSNACLFYILVRFRIKTIRSVDFLRAAFVEFVNCCSCLAFYLSIRILIYT